PNYSTYVSYIFFLLLQRRPGSTLFPYTTLFRSGLDVLLLDRQFLVALQLVGDDVLRGGQLGDLADTLGVQDVGRVQGNLGGLLQDRKSTRLNSSHEKISYPVFSLKRTNNDDERT